MSPSRQGAGQHVRTWFPARHLTGSGPFHVLPSVFAPRSLRKDPFPGGRCADTELLSPGQVPEPPSPVFLAFSVVVTSAFTDLRQQQSVALVTLPVSWDSWLQTTETAGDEPLG